MEEHRRTRRWPFATGVPREVDEELAFHLEMRARELEARGLSPDDARREARRRFGNLHAVATECRRLGERRERKVQRSLFLAELAQDARHALRQLRPSKGFAAIAVLTLGLGVGAATAIFSVVHGVLLRALPYPAAERLVVPRSEDVATGNRWNVTYADYEDWRRESVFEHVALYSVDALNTVGSSEAERLEAAFVTDGFFPTVGLGAALGVLPSPELFAPGLPPVTVISHGLWQRQFGGRTDVIGRTLQITSVPVEIVAVLPPAFGFPGGVDLWIPMRQTPATRPDLAERDNYIFGAVARLPADKTLDQAQAELATLAKRVEEDDPRERAGVTVTAEPLMGWMVGAQLSRMLWILLGAVGFVLLIGCVNVANLLLGRSVARRRELAVRAALGAGRGRLVRQLLTESAALGLLGGAVGVALAYGGVRLLTAFAPANTPRLEEVVVNATALGFALGVSLVAAMLFGLVPALQLSRRAREGAALSSEDVRTTRGVYGRRSRQVLVAVELALSAMLLIGAGLLGRSFVRLANTDPGFPIERLVTFELALQGQRYVPAGSRAAAFEALTQHVRGISGVIDASAMSSLPLGGGGYYLGRAFLPDGRPEPPDGDEVNASWIVTQPLAFRTMGIPVVRGRDFTAADDSASTPVMIVNREFARRMFGDDDPIGKRVRSWRDENRYREIVGVVGDVRFYGAADSVRALVYVPHAQSEWGQLAVVVRTAVEPAPLLPFLRAAVRAVDPGLPPSNVQTMEQVFRDSVARQRTSAYLMAVFAVVALTMAAVGIYGVLSYLVAQRSQEIGVRMALGARRGDVAWMVLGEAGKLVAVGVAVGITGAAALSRLLTALLFEVSPLDLVVFAGIPVLLATVALAASWVPARRAASVDPLVAIRVEA